MRAHSVDLRRKVLTALERGVPRSEVGGTFGVSESSVRGSLRRIESGQGFEPIAPPRRPRGIVGERHGELWSRLESNRDATVAEHSRLDNKPHGTTFSSRTLALAVGRAGADAKNDAGSLRAGWAARAGFGGRVEGREVGDFVVVNEYTEECLAIELGLSATSVDVVEALSRLIEHRGEPAYIRSDNGSEFIAEPARSWLAEPSAGTLYIEPGSPWQNGYSETFNSRFRDELLSREVLNSVAEAKVVVEDYRHSYNRGWPPTSHLLCRSEQPTMVGLGLS